MGKLGARLAVVGVFVFLSDSVQAYPCWYRGILTCKRCRPAGGKIGCPICKAVGKLSEPCKRCSGTGRRPCPKCVPAAVNGVTPGRLLCFVCRGTGTTTRSTFSVGGRSAERGTESRTCRECRGPGTITCLVCVGKGDLRCKKEERFYNCPLCSGDGRVGCPDCPRRIGRYLVFWIDQQLVAARKPLYEWRMAIMERNLQESRRSRIRPWVYYPPPPEFPPVIQEFLDTFQERMKLRFMEQLGVEDTLPPNLERS